MTSASSEQDTIAEMPHALEILYLCRDYVIIYKPYGVMSEDSNGKSDSCPAMIREYLGAYRKSHDVYCVHRLDCTTAGVMVYALNKKATALLSDEAARGLFHKTYAAFVTADPGLSESGEMRDFLFFDRKAGKSFVCKEGKRAAKEALLRYRKISDFMYDGVCVSKFEVKPETGRTHQIRAQFGARNSPLVGDGKYGSRINLKSPSLFSVELSFIWGNKTVTYNAPPRFLTCSDSVSPLTDRIQNGANQN